MAGREGKSEAAEAAVGTGAAAEVDDHHDEHRHPIVVLFKSPNEPLVQDTYYQEGQKRDYDVRFVPVLSFRTGKDGGQRLREALQASERYSGLVLTSQQAVHAIEECGVEKDTLQRWVSQDKKLFCVGPQTADKLRTTLPSADGMTVVSIFSAGNGQELSGVIISEMEARAQLPLLYLCGNIRRSELPSTLKAAGIAFEEMEVYETIPSPSLPPELAMSSEVQHAQQRVSWMCFFSPSGVKTIREELMKAQGTERTTQSENQQSSGLCKMAAIGPTTSNAVAEVFGRPPEATASSPCAVSLFDALDSFRNA